MLERSRRRMRKMGDQLARLASRYPLLGPVFWISSLQYFVIQMMVAAAWTTPFSWANNYISDLGNTECGVYDGQYVCSPFAWLMNTSFIVFGMSMALGAVLIYGQFIRTRLSLIAFILMVLSGIGTVLVGLFPENNPNGLHTFGAFLSLGVGNLSIILLGFALKGIRRAFQIYTIASGVFSLIAFGLFVSEVYLGFGRGGMERLISYPFTVWMILFGVYMTIVRMRARRTVSRI